MVTKVRITPAMVDPEYEWLKKEGHLSIQRFGGEDRGKGNVTGLRTGKLFKRKGRTDAGPERILAVGSFGVILQCLGLLWLLIATGIPIPWYSIFPVAIMIAGGVFIVRAIIHGREQKIMEAFSDRRYDSRN